MLRKSLLVASAAFAFATTAHAADLTGPYVGVGVTHDNVQGSGDAEGFGLNGIGGSVFAGYNIPLGAGFAGIEGNIDISSADEETFDVKAKWGWGIGARAGLSLSESTAAYVRAGYQRNQVEAAGDKFWGDGVRVGGGIETSLGATTSLRLEYNHVNYEDDLINNQALVGVVFGF